MIQKRTTVSPKLILILTTESNENAAIVSTPISIGAGINTLELALLEQSSTQRVREREMMFIIPIDSKATWIYLVSTNVSRAISKVGTVRNHTKIRGSKRSYTYESDLLLSLVKQLNSIKYLKLWDGMCQIIITILI